MFAVAPALLARDPRIPTEPLPFISRPKPAAPDVGEHPTAHGPFGQGVTQLDPVPAPQVTETVFVSPLLTRASVINGIANIAIRGGTISATPPLGAAAVTAVAQDTAAKRFPHNGVVDQAMSLNLVSLFRGSALGDF
jgi:hypothetical protein